MSTLSSISDTLGKVGSFPKQIEDITSNISQSAKTIDEIVDKMDNALNKVETHNPVTGAIVGGLSKVTGGLDTLTDKAVDVADNIENLGKNLSKIIEPISTAAQSVKKSVEDMQKCLDVVDISSALVDAVVNSFSGNFDAKQLASAISNFDNGWDAWAKVIETTYSLTSPSGQTNILKFLANEGFGDNIYSVGSAVKNESAGIFTGIANFESAVSAFGGSYRDPIAAAKKIETGVKGIVNAVEKVATSLNNIVKTLQLKGQAGNAAGNKVLSYLSNLHDTKVVSAINKVLTVGGSISSLSSDYNNLSSAWKNKDYKALYQAGRKTVDDVKKLIDSFKNNATAAQVTSAAATTSKGSAFAASKSKSQNSDSDSSGDDDSYVCSGATIKCTFGEKSVKLAVYPDRTVFLTGQPMANISDYVSMYNIPSFGKCKTTSYPPTGAATAAAQGALTPMPCVPGTNSNWLNGKDDYIIKGNPALLKSSYCKCCYGGVITITDDGQK